MSKSRDLNTDLHVVFDLHVHLVFVTKYRKNVFSTSMLIELKKSFSKVCSSFEAKLIEFNGETNHIHLLVTYPPKISISKLVNSLKGVSSRFLKSCFKRELEDLL